MTTKWKLALAAAIIVIFAACADPEPKPDPNIFSTQDGDRFRSAHVTFEGVDFICIVWENGVGNSRVGGIWCRESLLVE